MHLVRLWLLCANAHIIPLPSYSKCSYQYSLDLAIIFPHPESFHWSPCFVADCGILLSSSESLIDNLKFSQPSQVPRLWCFSADGKIPFMWGTCLAEPSALLFPWKMYFSWDVTAGKIAIKRSRWETQSLLCFYHFFLQSRSSLGRDLGLSFVAF